MRKGARTTGEMAPNNSPLCVDHRRREAQPRRCLCCRARRRLFASKETEYELEM